MKLFIIEDEVPIRQELTQFFEKYGFQCESSDDFHGIAQLALASGADLILLDINLPYQDGFQVCREIRQSSSVPIIVLASRNTDFDELMSLNIGADDFVSKPYNAQVRIRNRTARWFAICFPEYKDVYGDYKAVSGRMVLKEAPLPEDIYKPGAEGVNRI